LALIASEFGVSPWEYVTGERPGSVAALAFDNQIFEVLAQERKRVSDG
jgi:hypothetical protein